MSSQTNSLRFAATAKHFSFRLTLLITAYAGLPGCGGKSWQANTYPARGRATVNGQSASGAVVELHSAGEKKPDVRNSRPWAVVKEDGTFDLSTYELGDGAPPGEYALTLRWPPDANQPSLEDRLGGAYASPERSKWRLTIIEGENQLPPVEITGAKVRPKSQASAAAQRPAGPPMAR